MSEEILTLELGQISSSIIRVSAQVPLQILEFYSRRKIDLSFGTLLGSHQLNKIEITGCYAVPIYMSEEGELAIDKEYHKKMYELNKLVSPNEVIIGCFVTSTEITREVELFYHYYLSRESQFQSQINLPTPLLLLLDPQMTFNSSFNLRTYITTPLSICKDQLTLFQEVKLELIFGNDEHNNTNKNTSNTTTTTTNSELQNSIFNNKTKNSLVFQNVEAHLENIVQNLQIIENTLTHIDKTSMSHLHLAKSLRTVLSKYQLLTELELLNQITQYQQDVKLIEYLANLAHIEGVASEKLNKFSLNEI